MHCYTFQILSYKLYIRSSLKLLVGLTKFISQDIYTPIPKHIITNNTNLTCATTHLNRSGRWFATAVTNRPPLDPPVIQIFSVLVYFSRTKYSAAAMKSSKPFCFLSKLPSLCHFSPYSLQGVRKREIQYSLYITGTLSNGHSI